MKVSKFIAKIQGHESPKRMPKHFFYGAHHIDYDTARRADISKQHYTVLPRHWYIDATFVCCDCGQEFVFTTSEQRFWYENMRFFIDSLPKRCIRCRKSERTRLELRKHYDALIAEALGQSTIEMKKQVVEIVNELEAAGAQIPDKMAESRLKLYAQLSQSA